MRGGVAGRTRKDIRFLFVRRSPCEAINQAGVALLLLTVVCWLAEVKASH